ncbi:MAG TPA: T9SS type A sorting domain-containing protein [Cyclobacteriaceae bacterium]|jgi:hypothetical protein|nr:T9SS type A sorting domain-containing protein [Cyclobacteriaceae bacterium]
MNKLSVLVGFCLTSAIFPCAAQTFSTNGDWSAPGNWTPSSVPSGVGTAVTINANPTVSTSQTIGNIIDSNGVTYTITGAGNLQVGSSGNARSMTFNNNGQVTINTGGVLEIWGDLIVNNNLTLDVNGTLKVHGNVTMVNNASISVSGGGNVSVGGNLTGGQNTTIGVSGSGSILNVTGSLNLGGGTSSITNSGGTITAGSCSCSGCGSGSGCSGNVVLPVTLLYFKAVAESQEIKLNWSTASELNFDYFSLQQSSDGTSFHEITQVKGHGTTNEMHNYSYVDKDPTIGRSFYRLTSVDFDNYQEIFNVVSIDYQGEKKFVIVPNPSEGSSLKLNVNFVNDSNAQVIIYDNLGSVVATYQLNGSNSISIDNTLKSGVYLARYSSLAFTKTERFVVK